MEKSTYFFWGGGGAFSSVSSLNLLFSLFSILSRISFSLLSKKFKNKSTLVEVLRVKKWKWQFSAVPPSFFICLHVNSKQFHIVLFKIYCQEIVSFDLFAGFFWQISESLYFFLPSFLVHSFCGLHPIKNRFRTFFFI